MFRDASKLSNDRKGAVLLTLSDVDCETSTVLRIFLQLAAEGQITAALVYPVLRRLSLLLRKWDCAALQCAFRHLLVHNLCFGKLEPLTAFMLASSEDDKELATVALERPAIGWENSTGTCIGVAKNVTLSPQTWPLEYWEQIPVKYIFALSRAWAEVGRPDDTRKRLSAAFLRYLT